MRIIWHSNAPFTNSAYGIQTALFVPRIAALGHEIIISSPHSFAGSPLDWNGFQIIPAAGDVMGNDIITANYHYYKADLLITLCDVFGLGPSAAQLAGINVAHWTPVDCDPLGGGDLAVLREGMGTPIAMTRFGQDVMLNEGLDPYYIPHGINAGLYDPAKRDEVRETMDFKDAFIIGICAMNRDPVRKGLVEQIMAFRMFWENHPDSRLMIHSNSASDPGLHLDALVRALDFPPDVVMFPDKYSLLTGLISNEAMAAWFASLDILSACSYGEGFGMPVLEAQACGVPVVVTDFSGTGEMCFSGWKVTGKKHWINGHHSWWRRPEVHDIAAAYEEAWEARQDGKLPGIGMLGREKALEFDAGRITGNHWSPVLASIEVNLKGGMMAGGTLEIYGTDYPYGTVSAGGTDTSSTTWTVSTSLPFPQANYTGNPPAVFHVADPAQPAETIQVNYNNSNGTWTVVRGAENSSLIAHAAGFTVKQVVSAVNGYASFYQNANLGATALTTVSNSTLVANIASIYVPSSGSYPGGIGTGVSYQLTAFGSFNTSSNVANGSSTISVIWGQSTIASLVPGVNATRFINSSGTYIPFSVRSRVFFITATSAAAELELVWRNSTVTGATEAAASTSIVTAGPVAVNGTSGVATLLSLAWQWTNATSSLSSYGAAYQVQ